MVGRSPLRSCRHRRVDWGTDRRRLTATCRGARPGPGATRPETSALRAILLGWGRTARRVSRATRAIQSGLCHPRCKNTPMAVPHSDAGLGTIQVARRTLIQDNVRRYLVFIDDAPIGQLWPFQTGRYEVSAGRHQVRLSISGSTAESDAVVVDVSPGVVRRLRTRGRGWRDNLTLPMAMFASAQGKLDTSRSYKRPWIVLQADW